MPNYDITPGTAFTQLLLHNHPGAIAWVSGSEPMSLSLAD